MCIPGTPVDDKKKKIQPVRKVPCSHVEADIYYFRGFFRAKIGNLKL